MTFPPSSGERCLHCKRMILSNPSGPAILLLRTHPEEPKAPSRRILCTALFMAALLTRARTRSTPSAHGPTKGCRRSCVHTAACCSALRRKGMLTHAAPCVYLTDVLLSKGVASSICPGCCVSQFAYLVRSWSAGGHWSPGMGLRVEWLVV